jgi:Beta/Gamma crystallin
MSILRKNFPHALAATVAAICIWVAPGAVYAQSGSAATEGQSTSQGKNTPPSEIRTKEGGIIVEVPVIMMVPTTQSEKLAMEKGCWVRLYDKKNFDGNSLLLIGPINLGRMIGPFGVNWENKVRSLQTGPNTNLTIFDNRDFKDEDKFVDPNMQIPNLSRKMRLFDNFRSMILNCI